MGTLTHKIPYKCYNDCVQYGCPGHEAIVTYQSTSDAYPFDDGRGLPHSISYFDPKTLQIFIDALKIMDTSIIKI
jgi:hypothetical protein